MSSIVLLDTGLLGLITHPKASLEADQCAQWLVMLSMKGVAGVTSNKCGT